MFFNYLLKSMDDSYFFNKIYYFAGTYHILGKTLLRHRVFPVAAPSLSATFEKDY